MLVLALTTLALARDHTETVGSTTSNTTLEDKWAAQFYTATTTVRLTGLSFWGYEQVSGSTGTVTAYLWTRTSSGSWTATSLGNISVTSTTPARFRSTLATPQTLTAGQTYGIGFSSSEGVWTQGYWTGSGTSGPSTVAWGTALGCDIDFVGASSRNLTSSDVSYLARPGHYMDMVIDYPDGDGDGADMIDDCDDDDATVSPDLPEVHYDGLDQDCDGVDDDNDADGDGHDADFMGGDDCDDAARGTYPGARDTWYDGVDSDCAGNDDFDQDRDGYAATSGGGADCDDTSSAIRPGAVDTFYDGVDTDCAGNDDYDLDGDGHRARAYGGDDCDDNVAAIYPGASDRDYDGIDSDCAGDSDYDRDGDGHESSAHGGDDCDDEDASIWTDCPALDTGDTGGTDTGNVDTGGTDTGDVDTGGDTSVEDTADTGVDTVGSSRRRVEKDTGGCATAGGTPAGWGLLVAALAAGRRRRRV